jgi:hypothetical protein
MVGNKNELGIHIPFNEWSLCRIEASMKSATSRTKAYGNPGDEFEVDFTTGKRVFKITNVQRMTLGEVAEHHYLEEGAISKEEFIHIWRQLYPSLGFSPDLKVFFHQFVPK